MATVVVTEPITSGRVLLKTTIGEIDIELWPREAPKAVRNFVQLALEGYYDGCIFHRVIQNFIAQTGDPTGTGTGGECIYDEGTFEDEFSQRIRFNRRGLVGMANQGSRNTNLSQFFFTLGRADELNNHNTIFGRIAAGDTLYNVLKLNEIELAPGSERPAFPPVIRSIEVLDNPFPDIVPRITAKERREQDKAKKEVKAERVRQKEQSRRKGTKNAALLSFGDEPEEPVDETLAKTKFKSAHDLLDDDRTLSKQVVDDRGTYAEVPAELLRGGPSSKRKVDDEDEAMKRPVKVQQSEVEKLVAAKKAVPKPAAISNDNVKAEIAKVQADLRRMNGEASDSDEDSRKAKKVKRTGPSLLQLEREKYAASASRGKKRKGVELDLEDVLGSFRTKLKDARDTAPPKPDIEEIAGEAFGGSWRDVEDDDGDDDWLGHKLQFRKDVTLDMHKYDEYVSIDPLAKNTKTLEDMKRNNDDAPRRYAGDERETRREDKGKSRGGGGGGGRDNYRRDSGRREGNRDRDDRSRRERDEYDRRPSGSRPEVRQDWRSQRVNDYS